MILWDPNYLSLSLIHVLSTIPYMRAVVRSYVPSVDPGAVAASVSMTLSTLQQWLLQCQPCSYGCSSVNDIGTTMAAVLTISYHYANHQLNPAVMWILQTQPCINGCVKATGASIAAVLTHTQLTFASSSPYFFSLLSQPLLLPAYHSIYWVTKIPEKPVAHVKRSCCPHGHVLPWGIIQLLRI